MLYYAQRLTVILIVNFYYIHIYYIELIKWAYISLNIYTTKYRSIII